MKTKERSSRLILNNLSIQGVYFILILFLCVGIATADSKEGLPDVSGIWDLGYNNYYWKLTQSGTRIEGTWSSNNAGGILHGELIGNKLVLDWKCTWDNNRSDGFLNSGRNVCVLSEDGRQLAGKIEKIKDGNPNWAFTLLRCPYTPPPPLEGLEGNWIVEYSDADNIKGKTKIGGWAVWLVLNPDGTTTWRTSYSNEGGMGWTPSSLSLTPEGTIKIQHNYLFMGNWGAKSTSRQVGPNNILGRWTYGEDYGGAMVWRRALPKIKTVTFSSGVNQTVAYGSGPGRVEFTYNYTFESWVTARANRPTINITLHGDHLWGRHHLWIDPATDLELQKGGFTCSDYPGPPSDREVFSTEIWLWSKVTPGRKVLYFDGMPIAFDLVIHGYPNQKSVPTETKNDPATGSKEQKVQLSLLGPGDFDGEPIDAIEGAIPFRVELKYREKPEKAPKTVIVSGQDASRNIQVHATDNPNVFRTGWYSLVSAAERGFREVEGFNVSSPEESARIATELFKGKWYVSSSGGKLDQGMGVGFVSDTGAAAQLYLKVGETERLYDAFEILATKDSTGGQHTLDIRFEELGADDSPLTQDIPEIQAFYIDEGTETLTFAVDNEQLEVPVTLPEPPGERIRVSLICREGGKQLSGRWYTELSSGDLGDGGQQIWTRDTTKVEGVIVVDDQLDASAGYNYPYAPDGSEIKHLRTTRTLVVYGSNLPEFADGAVIESLSNAVEYQTDPRSANDRKLVIEKAFKKAEVENFDQYDAFIVKASLSKGIKPGTKSLSVNKENLSWPLLFANQHAVMRFVRHAGDMEMATNVFYPGDIGYVKLSFKADLPLKEIPISISMGRLSNPFEYGVLLARRLDDDDPVFKNYITEPIHLYHRSNTELSPPDDLNALRIPVLEGGEINAKLVDPAEALAFPPVVQAKILNNPNQLGPLWKEALDRVAVCYGETIEDYDKYQNEEATRISRIIIAEFKRRNIPIKKGDHAAAILIRDEFIKSTMESIPEFEKLVKNIEYIRAYRERAKSSQTLANDPFWRTFEATYSKEGTLWDSDTKVPLAETLDESAIAKKFNISQADARKWAEEQTMAAFLKQIELMYQSVSWAQDAGDCSMDKLLLIAGHKSPEIVGRILPRLVKLKIDAGPPKRQYWVTDETARAYVKGLYITGEAVRSLEAYSEVDTQVALAVATIATMGTSAVLEGIGYAGAALWTSLAMDFGDLAYGAYGVKKYIDGEDYYDLAIGATPALGEGVLDDAYGKRQSAVMTAVGILLPGASGASNLSRLRHFKNVQRGKELFENTDNVLDGLSTLQDADRVALAGYYTDMLAKVRRSGINKLTEADRIAFNAFRDYFEYQEVIRKAQDALGRPLSVSQQKALNKAHLYGTLGPNGKYSWGDLRAKRRMLIEGGFSKHEATLLMRRGIAGKAKLPQPKVKLNPKMTEVPGIDTTRLSNRSVPDEIRNKYTDAIKRARDTAGGRAGACEDAKLHLLLTEGFGPETLQGGEDLIGRGPNQFQHEYVITREGYILDPVAQQAVDVHGLTTWEELKAIGIDAAVSEGIFTREQWELFKNLGGN